MNALPSSLVRLLLIFAVLPPASTSASPTPDRPTLIVRGGAVIDVETGSIRRDVDIRISGDRIVSVTESDPADRAEEVQPVDATGLYVIPGLWDMHVHAHRAGRARWFYPLFIAHGVTGVREMASHLGSLLAWRNSRQAPAPRVIWSSPMIDGAPPTWNQGLAAESPDAARALVRLMKSLGFDLIKVYGRIDRDSYYALADEAKRAGIPFAGHVPYSITPAEASDAGQHSIEHLWLVLESCVPGGLEQVTVLGDNPLGLPVSRGLAELLPRFDEKACGELFARFKANGTWQTPTLVQERGTAFTDDAEFTSDSRVAYVPESVRAEWQQFASTRSAADNDVGRTLFNRRKTLVAEMQRAGVGILAGTDASDEPWVFPGSSLHEELSLMVSGGMTPLEALQAATLNPARALNATASQGTVTAGKVADLVLLDANPLEDIANTRRIRAVILKGKLFDRARLDELVELAEREAGR